MGDSVSFEAFEGERDRLLASAARIDRAWGAFIAARSQFEALGEGPSPEGPDPVRANLEEARARLGRPRVEVVIAGLLNRGKSTLINSLLGTEVSSMRVTPETARPVYVSYGDRRAWAVFAGTDGGSERVEEVDDPEHAAQIAGERSASKDDAAIRLEQQVPSALLRSGVVLKDTPGLDDADPALADQLEQLTYAELDLATATVIVLVSPPGLAGLEMKILSGLDDRRVDKTFIVCNFFSEQWDDAEVRGDVLEHVARTVRGTPAEGARIFPVNAKRAWLARRTGDSTAFEDSGVAALEQELERYLCGGALAETIDRSVSHLGDARVIALEAVQRRLALLRDPSDLEASRAEKQRAVEDARSRLESIGAEAELGLTPVADAIRTSMAQPFDSLVVALQSLDSKSELASAQARFDVELDIARARSAATFDEGVAQVEDRARSALLRSFDVMPEGRMADREVVASFGSAAGTAMDLRTSSGFAATGTVAAAGALLGGSIAGGAGLALVAMGPVGWIAGAAIGAVLAGSLAMGYTSSTVSRSDRDRLIGEVQARRAATLAEVDRLVRGVGSALVRSLQDQFDAFAHGELAELRAIERVLRSPETLSQLTLATESVRADLVDVTFGGKHSS